MKINRNKEISIINKITEFDKLGGCVEFKIFTIDKPENSYQTHCEVAKETLTELSKANEACFQKIAQVHNTNRDQYFKLSINFEELEKSGIQIKLREFLGPQFDLKTGKPLIKGVQRLYNSYFYFDTEENENNIINIEEVSGQFNFIESDGVTSAFCGAFLEPPHSVRIGKTILEHGQYFLEFCNFLFSDLKLLEIYKWSVNCSNYFDAGKEWWGSHFWTIYNPTKNIYIGIVASTTD